MMFSSDEFDHLKIPLESILIATNNFAHGNVVGTDDFDKRYKGRLLWSGELIEIDARRLNKDLEDGEQKFWMEISMLSSLKHKNLVSLVGFCDEKIIITRYETRGSLSQYLSDPMLLTWVRRLEISVGIVQALRYIHYDESRDFSVIHRLITSGRVLLNDDWEPKLSGFECSMKIKASQRHHSFHTNRREYVKGYGDPTYIETKSVNHKLDIYSFGIVLFGLLCGRKAVLDDQDNKYLSPMAIFHYKKKILDEIIDPVLWNQMDPKSFNIFAETAYACLNEERSLRPDISEVVTRLESTLKLQMECQNVEHSIVADNVEDTSSNHDKENHKDNLKLSLQDIKLATKTFNQANLIGHGDFGNVYKGHTHGHNFIAAKRLGRKSAEGEAEFMTELEILMEYKHENVIGLVGYCD